MTRPDRAKRTIGAIYSRAARRVYDPVVVGLAFPLLAGDMEAEVAAQAAAAAAAAGGRPILDVPVGTAHFTIGLAARHSGIVVGCDLAEGMVVKASGVVADAGVTNVSVVRADIHALPLADGAFAAVMCTNGLQVIPDLDAAAAELRRVLAPGGRLFVAAVALPLSTILPAGAGAKLPTLLRSRHEVVRRFENQGFEVTSSRRRRLGIFIEARRR